MKILLTSPYYPPHIGGIEIHTMNLARGMKERGHDVEVVTSMGEDRNVKITIIPCLQLPYSPIPLSFPEVEGDVFHSHVPSPFFARCLMKKDYRPHVITYHNDVFVPNKVDGKPIPRFGSRWVERVNDELVRPVLDDADVIIATTKSYAETSPILKDYLDRVRIIPNAVRVKEFLPGRDAGERDKIVLYAGRLAEYKGLPTLIRAMRNIKARLVVLGDGEDRNRFEELARKLEVRVEFRGRVSDDELKYWMRRARVLVLPARSRLEAFGIVLIEAMACKTPVIASKIPGVGEVAKNAGMLFGDEEELTLNIMKILEEDELATKLGKRGRRVVEQKYDWEVVLNKIEKLYSEL
jgi:glycosyltransferase involved in cell wall biosynthesis